MTKVAKIELMLDKLLDMAHSNGYTQRGLAEELFDQSGITQSVESKYERRCAELDEYKNKLITLIKKEMTK